MKSNSHASPRGMQSKHMKESEVESLQTLAHQFDLDNYDETSVVSTDSIFLDSIFDVDDSDFVTFFESLEDPMQEKSNSFASSDPTAGDLMTAMTGTNEVMQPVSCSMGKIPVKRRRTKPEAPRCEHFGSNAYSVSTYSIGHRADRGWYVTGTE